MIRKVGKYNDNHVIVFYPEDYFLSEDAINQIAKKISMFRQYTFK